MTRTGPRMDLQFRGEVWHWRGPAPFYFVTVPDAESGSLRAVSSAVTYGWGMVPVRVRIGAADWRTSLFPKDRRYVVRSRTPCAVPRSSTRGTRSPSN